MKKYRAVYELEDDGRWTVRLLQLRGCHSYGRTVEQARERIREALGLFVDDGDRADIVDEYLGSLDESCFSGVPQISALVAGAAFVDAAGGNIKWRFDKFVRNPAAVNPVSDESLLSVCRANCALT